MADEIGKPDCTPAIEFNSLGAAKLGLLDALLIIRKACRSRNRPSKIAAPPAVDLVEKPLAAWPMACRLRGQRPPIVSKHRRAGRRAFRK